tara:strand:+ start:103 stop:543 length:441 start_codon:yes stop_codon:yes gene_type:complete
LREEVTEILRSLVITMGYDFWGLNFSQNNNSLKLTLYIDKEQGINIDDCEKVSNQTTHMLDTKKILDVNYILEVSSPGLDRVLITKEHFKKYMNENIKVKLKWLVKNRKNINGIIKDVQTDCILLDVNKEIFEIRYDSIDSARLNT